MSSQCGVESKMVCRVILTVFLISLSLVPQLASAAKCTVPQVSELKEFKKFVKSRSNILVIFVAADSDVNSLSNSLICETVKIMKGQCDISFVNCGGSGKKLCKQQKVNPAPYLLHHFSNGEFNKQYDRPMVSKSLVAFLKNPTGDAPWSDDPSALDVTHVDDAPSFQKLITREKLPVLVMFYAPWCGHCKRLKPQYSVAAQQAKGVATLAAFDVSSEELSSLRYEYNITGFPTLIYFSKGKVKFLYQGEQSSDAILDWLQNPKPFEKTEPEPEVTWEESEAKDVVKFLDDATFDDFMKNNPSVYLMVYAPWCGHCKRMKPDYEDAAREMKETGIPGVLAAVDATKNPVITQTLGVNGYPSVKYFKNGEQPDWSVNFRTKDTIMSFMKDPKEPPPPPKEPTWEEEATDVVFLDDETFLQSLKKKKASLVMFFTPWCGHCKKAKPEFNMAATQMKTQSKVLFGAVDCTKQTELCSKFGVTGYPTLKMFSYGKNPVDYSGPRSQGDFVEYLNGVAGLKDEL